MCRTPRHRREEDRAARARRGAWRTGSRGLEVSLRVCLACLLHPSRSVLTPRQECPEWDLGRWRWRKFFQVDMCSCDGLWIPVRRRSLCKMYAGDMNKRCHRRGKRTARLSGRWLLPYFERVGAPYGAQGRRCSGRVLPAFAALWLLARTSVWTDTGRPGEHGCLLQIASVF